MEVRLCGVEEAQWLEGAARQSLPPSPRPRERSKVGIGRSLTRRIESEGSVSAAALSPVEGMLLANAGVRFESPHFLASVAHALALPAVLRGSSDREAKTIVGFVEGQTPFSRVPALLKQAGVFSVLRQTEALRLADWCRFNLGSSFEHEVASMYGAGAVADYVAEANLLIDMLQSTATHDSDLCCWSGSEESQ
jgi:hypothetical protein